jgi:hypothetical protein
MLTAGQLQNDRLCRRACPQLIDFASLSAGIMRARIAGVSRAASISTAQDADNGPGERRLGVLERDRHAQPVRASIRSVAMAMSRRWLHL